MYSHVEWTNKTPCVFCIRETVITRIQIGQLWDACRTTDLEADVIAAMRIIAQRLSVSI